MFPSNVVRYALKLFYWHSNNNNNNYIDSYGLPFFALATFSPRTVLNPFLLSNFSQTFNL